MEVACLELLDQCLDILRDQIETPPGGSLAGEETGEDRRETLLELSHDLLGEAGLQVLEGLLQGLQLREEGQLLEELRQLRSLLTGDERDGRDGEEESLHPDRELRPEGECL